MTVVALLLVVGSVAAQPRAGAAIVEPVTFMSGPLRIAAVLGRPRGDGPFPAYISNHGSMTPAQASGGRWTSITKDSLADVLVRNGYVVLVVARRGHRGSEGTTLTYSSDSTNRVVRNAADVIRGAEAETEDVLAALEYLSTRPFIDRERIAVGGVSLGGLVSVMAATREPRFRALLSMAGGYKQTNAERGGADEAWPLVQQVWKEAAARVRIPTLILWSRNDTKVEVDVGRDLEKRLRAAGVPVEMKVYPAFRDNGHYLFSNPEGYPTFVPDALAFLDAHLKR
jgi:dienelactone hydrolase